MSTLIIYLTLIALITSYAFMMSILNKTHNLVWLKWESYLTTAVCLILLVICFQPLLRTYSVPFLMFGGSLILASINAIILSITHFKHLSGATEYPETIVTTTKKLGIAIFALLCFAMLSLVSSFPF